MRTRRLVASAVLAGGMLAVAIVTVMTDKPMASPRQATLPAKTDATRSSALSRCRQMAQPDEACGSLWEAERRRFLGLDGDESPPQDME